jgi:hypothetical protein
MTRFDGLTENTHGAVLQPAVNFGPSNGSASVLAASGAFGGKVLKRSTVLNAAGPGPATLSPAVSINVPTYAQAPDAHQPDPHVDLDTTYTWLNRVVEQGNNLWAVHSINVGGRPGIRWYQIDETTNTLKQSGTISDPKLAVFEPSIAVNDRGDVVIGFNQSGPGPTDFASAFAVVGSTDAQGVTSFSAPRLLAAGLTSYVRPNDLGGTVTRWGDYSNTVFDPSDPNVAWTFQEIPIAANTWATQISQIILVPEPAATWLLGMAMVAAMRRRRR